MTRFLPGIYDMLILSALAVMVIVGFIIALAVTARYVPYAIKTIAYVGLTGLFIASVTALIAMLVSVMHFQLAVALGFAVVAMICAGLFLLLLALLIEARFYRRPRAAPPRGRG